MVTDYDLANAEHRRQEPALTTNAPFPVKVAQRGDLGASGENSRLAHSGQNGTSSPAVAPVAPLLGDRGELADLAAACALHVADMEIDLAGASEIIIH